jgi:hypothetical protein
MLDFINMLWNITPFSILHKQHLLVNILNSQAHFQFEIRSDTDLHNTPKQKHTYTKPYHQDQQRIKKCTHY